MEKGKIDKDLNIEENSFLYKKPIPPPAGKTNKSDLNVKLPDSANAIAILFCDNLQDVSIGVTPLLWDMLKCLLDQKIKFTQEKGMYKLTVTIEMEKIN